VSDDTFATPEEAALAAWMRCPAAGALVESCEVNGDEAWVVIVTDPRHRERNFCVREDGGWYLASSGGSLRPSEVEMAAWVRPLRDS
jgi:hypothetical protein